MSKKFINLEYGDDFYMIINKENIDMVKYYSYNRKTDKDSWVKDWCFSILMKNGQEHQINKETFLTLIDDFLDVVEATKVLNLINGENDE